MINPDTDQVFQLADYFSELAHAVEQYIDFNKGNVSEDERNQLYDMQIELSQMSGRINMAGVELAFEDVKDTLKQLRDITERVKKSVKRALVVQDAINITAALVSIGTAIIARQPKDIVQSCAQAAQAVKIKK